MLSNAIRSHARRFRPLGLAPVGGSASIFQYNKLVHRTFSQGTDEDIANACKMQPILQVAQEKLGIGADVLEPYGRFKAKLPFTYLNSLPDKKGKLILVTAMTPTKAGEGKTTVSVGLSDGLCLLGST